MWLVNYQLNNHKTDTWLFQDASDALWYITNTILRSPEYTTLPVVQVKAMSDPSAVQRFLNKYNQDYPQYAIWLKERTFTH